MKKENVIDLDAYRERRKREQSQLHSAISSELASAIEMLIYQMRELGPVQRAR